MLRLQLEGSPQVIPSMHYPQYTEPTYSLYRLGEKLSFPVSYWRGYIQQDIN